MGELGLGPGRRSTRLQGAAERRIVARAWRSSTKQASNSMPAIPRKCTDLNGSVCTAVRCWRPQPDCDQNLIVYA